MSKFRSRLGALIVLGIALGVQPVSATENPFDGQCGLAGDGTSTSPWLLGSEGDLIQVEDCLVSSITNYFALSQDIFINSGYTNVDRDSYLDDSSERVHLDGKGYGIYGLKLMAPDALEVGLFGDLRDLTVKDLTIVSGAIVGGNETSVLVGEVNNLVVENVTITNDSLTCSYECGLLAARVVETATIENVSVSTGSFLAGDQSGLLIGDVASATVTIDTVHAVGRFQLRQFETDGSGLEFGALIGRVNESNVSITNAYISLEPIERESIREGFECTGGVIGRWGSFDSDPGQSLTLKGVSTNFDIRGARHFGGLVGCAFSENDSDPGPASVLTFDFDDVSVMGTVWFGSFDFTAHAGGLIGDSDLLAQHVTTLDVKDALIEVEYNKAYNLTNIEVNSIAETDTAELSTAEWDTVNYTNVYLNSTIWNDANPGDFVSFDIDADGQDISTADLAVQGNLAFENMVTHPGVLGTDDWEHCDLGPRPVITPNYCSSAEIALSQSQITAVLGEAADSITDTNAKGFGQSLFYTAEPSLPVGMYLNPLTGVVAGTPLELRTAQTYRIRKYNAYTNPFLSYFDQGPANSYFFVLETKLPQLQQGQISESVEQAATSAAYAGPILVQFSKQTLFAGEVTEVTVIGERLDIISSISVQGRAVEVIRSSPDLITLRVPGLEPGSVDLIVTSSQGLLTHLGAFTVISNKTEPIVSSEEAKKVVNAGSFKGYVAIYAKGYEGKRLSAKVGNDWVIVPEIVNNQESGTLFRVVEFTGAGYDIEVRIYIDRVLVNTVDLLTK